MVPPCQFTDAPGWSQWRPAAWSSGTAGSPGYLVFQADGNVVIYEWFHDQARWSSNTSKECTRPDQQKTLTFQQDGNLVIYCHQRDGSMNAMWSTNTQMR